MATPTADATARSLTRSRAHCSARKVTIRAAEALPRVDSAPHVAFGHRANPAKAGDAKPRVLASSATLRFVT